MGNSKIKVALTSLLSSALDNTDAIEEESEYTSSFSLFVVLEDDQ